MRLFIVLLALSFAWNSMLLAQEDEESNDLKLGVKSFISYESEIEDNAIKNDYFSIRRAYFTVKKDINNYLNFRMTIDTYEDDDGQEQRIKYLYANFKIPKFSILDNTNVRAGIIHTPWLDFQTDFYKYRAQGQLYLDKVDIFDSADFGVTLFGDINEGTGDDSKRIGSYSLGMYDGSGYKAFELNPNKVFQMRLSLYPLWKITQNWNISYLFIRGESNIEDPQINPDFITNSIYTAYRNGNVSFTAEYVFGEGNQNGSLITADDISVKYDGFSLFGEYKPFERFAVIGRYDHFEEKEDVGYMPENRLIGGIAWYFNSSNFLLLDYEGAYNNGLEEVVSEMLKLTLQIKFDHIID